MVLFALTVVGQALTPSTYFTTVDKERLRTIFLSAEPYQPDNLQAVHYSVLGLALLGAGHVEPSVSRIVAGFIHILNLFLKFFPMFLRTCCLLVS